MCLGREGCFSAYLPEPLVSAAVTGTRTERSRFSRGWHREIQRKVSNNGFLQRGGLAGNNPAAGAGRSVGWKGLLEGTSPKSCRKGRL